MQLAKTGQMSVYGLNWALKTKAAQIALRGLGRVYVPLAIATAAHDVWKITDGFIVLNPHTVSNGTPDGYFIENMERAVLESYYTPTVVCQMIQKNPSIGDEVVGLLSIVQYLDSLPPYEPWFIRLWQKVSDQKQKAGGLSSDVKSSNNNPSTGNQAPTR